MTLGPDRRTVLRWTREPLFHPEGDGATGGEGGGEKKTGEAATGEKKTGESGTSGTDSDANREKTKVLEKDGVRYVAQDDVDRIIGETRKEARERVEKELKDAEAAAKLKESGDYKTLYEAAEAARVKAEQERDDAKLSSLRVEIGEKFGLSATLSARLQGTTSAELTKDAKAIAEELGIDPDKKETRKTPAVEGGARTRKSTTEEAATGGEKKPAQRFAFQSEGDVKRWG